MNKLFPIVTLLIGFLLGLPLAQGQTAKLTPADSFFGGKAKLENLLDDPRLKLFPTEVAEAIAKQQFGLNLKELLAATFLAREVGPKKEPHWIWVLRFSAPQTLGGEELEKMTKTVDAELGVTIHKSKYDSQPSILASSPTTVVMGPIAALKSYYTEPVKGEVGKLLVKNSLDTDIGFYFDQRQGQFLWNDFRGYLVDAEFPPEIANLEKLSKLIQTIEGGINYKTNYDGIIAANCASPSDAAQAKQILVTAFDYFQKHHLLALEKFASETATGSNWKNRRIKNAGATLKYFQRIYPKYKPLLTPEVEGNRLVLKIDQRHKFLPVVFATMVNSEGPDFDFKPRMNTKNQMRQILLALHNYQSANRGFPSIEQPSRIARLTLGIDTGMDSENEDPLYGVRVSLLPYLEQNNLFDSWDRKKAWDSTENAQHAKKVVPAFGESATTRFRFPVLYLDDAQVKEKRSQSALSPNEEVFIQQFADGTSNTIMLIEAPEDKAVPWASPELWVLDKDDLIGSVFGDRSEVTIGMADGSVHVIQRDKVTQEIMMHLLNRSDGQVVKLRDYK